MTMSVWDYILENTNQYARNRLASVPPRRRSIFRNWKDIAMVEMKAFIGVIIQMGLVHLSDIKDYWSTHVTLNFEFLRSVFSRVRFLQCFMSIVGRGTIADKNNIDRNCHVKQKKICLPLSKQTSKRREMLPHTKTRWWLCNGQINGQSFH